jgi:hypothetical protein
MKQQKHRWRGKRSAKRLAEVHASRILKHPKGHNVGALNQPDVIPIVILERKLIELQKVVLNRIAMKNHAIKT